MMRNSVGSICLWRSRTYSNVENDGTRPTSEFYLSLNSSDGPQQKVWKSNLIWGPIAREFRATPTWDMSSENGTAVRPMMVAHQFPIRGLHLVEVHFTWRS